MSNYLSRLNRERGCTFNYSLLIANCSFPQGYVNPPIRGSIVVMWMAIAILVIGFQSPYKGFNRENKYMSSTVSVVFQSPYKGFNSKTPVMLSPHTYSVSIPL